jgi:hypothetical protein
MSMSSFFKYILDKKLMYDKWSKKIFRVHLIKHLAINSFGFSQEQLPSDRPDEYGYDEEAFKEYYGQMVKQIVEKIVLGP